LPRLREEARRCARFPAENARYPLFPLLCWTSRATVLGARPNRRARAERLAPCARPRLTSSRSVAESRWYGLVNCIRIHSTHIRCVKCLTPRANTPPVFSSLRPRSYQQLLCLATMNVPGQRGPTLFEKSLHFVEETIAVFFDRHTALFAEFLEQFLLASGQFGGNLNLHDK